MQVTNLNKMKTITIRYFDVEYKPGLTCTESLVFRVLSKLSSTASKRLMPVNKQESDRYDLVSNFLNVKNGEMVAGTSLRIVNSKDVPIITEEMLGQTQFTVSSINEQAKEDEKTCLDYFYFCLSDKQLIVTLDSRSGISRFETYLNWLLNTVESGEHIKFTPMVDEETLSVADIKRITIGDSYDLKMGSDSTEGETVKSKMVNLSNEVFRKLFSDTVSLKDLMDAKICSANLVIRFSKPRGMDEDEYKRKTSGAILKQLEDTNSVRFQTKGKKIAGSQILKIEQIEVDSDDKGAVSENDVYQKIIQKMS